MDAGGEGDAFHEYLMLRWNNSLLTDLSNGLVKFTKPLGHRSDVFGRSWSSARLHAYWTQISPCFSHMRVLSYLIELCSGVTVPCELCVNVLRHLSLNGQILSQKQTRHDDDPRERQGPGLWTEA